ncbi:solute carrier family 23 member 1 isoform X3 [Corvus kubaryi]|uniref:solute carrier family 23 member 1 isoform X3 n=1 Tax=Corvus kubaryi TaxID=68294 RepID=UPI001C04EC7E|nr:solute carrier family 23 member 1 isoform X3 [Corvus kubaryi]
MADPCRGCAPWFHNPQPMAALPPAAPASATARPVTKVLPTAIKPPRAGTSPPGTRRRNMGTRSGDLAQPQNGNVALAPAGSPQTPGKELPAAGRQDHGAGTRPPRPEMDMLYRIEDVPPWYLCILLGFQHYLTCFSGTIAVPFLLAESLCVGKDQLTVSYLIGTIFTCVGITTLIQTTVGIRLPLFQASALAFLVPAKSILALEKWRCPSEDLRQLVTAPQHVPHLAAPHARDPGGHHSVQPGGSGHRAAGAPRGTAQLHRAADRHPHRVPHRTLRLPGGWRPGWLPLGHLCANHLPDCPVCPVPAAGRHLPARLPAGPRLCPAPHPDLQDVPDHPGHHGGVAHLLRADPHRSLPQPARGVRVQGQDGRPGRDPVRGTLVPRPLPLPVGVAHGDLSSRAGHVQCHTGGHHRIHRGLLLLCPAGRSPPAPCARHQQGHFHRGHLLHHRGAVGNRQRLHVLQPQHRRPGHHQGTGAGGGSRLGRGAQAPSPAAGVSVQVGSRRVIQYGAGIMLVLGTIGKFTALFASLPDPVLGGMFCTLFGMITAVGLSNLQFVDMNSSRNLFVLGFAMFFGLTLPNYLNSHPGAINTGVPELDQILTVLLTTEMFVGGTIAFVLDNTIPGTQEERGLVQWKAGAHSDSTSSASLRSYDFPLGMGAVRRSRWLRKVPICPVFTGFRARASGRGTAAAEGPDGADGGSVCTKV